MKASASTVNHSSTPTACGSHPIPATDMPVDVPGVDVISHDGRRVRVRSLRRQDEAALRALHHDLSDRSSYLRFFTLSRGVAEDYVTTLLHPVVGGETAIVATLDGVLIGVGTFARLDGCSAEIAVLIADTAQHHGIGTLLLERLIDIARARGISRFVADVLLENATMLRVLSDLHYPMHIVNEGGSEHIVIDLIDTPQVRAAHIDRVRTAAAARTLSRRSMSG